MDGRKCYLYSVFHKLQGRRKQARIFSNHVENCRNVRGSPLPVKAGRRPHHMRQQNPFRYDRAIVIVHLRVNHKRPPAPGFCRTREQDRDSSVSVHDSSFSRDMASDAETALAAELKASRERAEQLAALLDAERKRAAEAELLLMEKEKALAESNRPKIDPEEARQHRQVLARNVTAIKQHSQRYSNASKAVEVVLPGIKANAKNVKNTISTHFGFLRQRLKEREDKLLALVDGLASERTSMAEAQRARMDAIVGECEMCIGPASEVIAGDDWGVLTKHEACNAQIARAIAKSCELDSDWSEQIVARLPPAIEEIVESHGQVSVEAIQDPASDWHRDLAILSRIAQPPTMLRSSRGTTGNSDHGFMFEITAHDTAVCIKTLHMASSTGWGPWPYTVYTAPGGWKQIRNSQRKWLKVGNGEATLPRATGTGVQSYGPLPISEEGVHIAAGAKQAFYVHSPSHPTAVAFATSPQDAEGNSLREGTAVDSDGRVSIGTGAKTCSGTPFESVATDSVRAFAGVVEYVLWCEA